ncbi:MAG: lipase family protein [Sphingomonas sp.]|jgi:hypothetical protein|uniref:lipase family protein n=1 Tax=Sphingomonas sp. TaxID=28214 RepID=UPI0035659AB9
MTAITALRVIEDEFLKTTGASSDLLSLSELRFILDKMLTAANAREDIPRTVNRAIHASIFQAAQWRRELRDAKDSDKEALLDEFRQKENDLADREAKLAAYWSLLRWAMSRKRFPEQNLPPHPFKQHLPKSAPIDTAELRSILRASSPLSELFSLINTPGLSWDDDAKDDRKAYIMSCLSELTYLHLDSGELESCDRYSIFEPSIAQMFLRHLSITPDLRELLGSFDIPTEVVTTELYVYVVLRFPSFTVVAVRGTAAVRDWGINLDAFKNHARHGFYHRGFDDEAKRAMELLKNKLGSTGSLYFTGHSLGGAVASILAQTWPERHRVRIPYLFSSPRFATRAGASRLPRYVYLRPLDPVPHVPPRFLGYSDAGAIFDYLPAEATPRGGLAAIWHMASRRTIEQHSMEGVRRLLGQRLGSDFPEHVYIDAFIKTLRTVTKNGQ